MISGLMSTSKKGDAMTVAEFIEELQEDYDPDVQIKRRESSHEQKNG